MGKLVQQIEGAILRAIVKYCKPRDINLGAFLWEYGYATVVGTEYSRAMRARAFWIEDVFAYFVAGAQVAQFSHEFPAPWIDAFQKQISHVDQESGFTLAAFACTFVVAIIALDCVAYPFWIFLLSLILQMQYIRSSHGLF